jgi:hypothetical protein
MLHYPTDWQMRDGGGWREVTPFLSVMRLVSMERGRSAAFFVVEDEQGHDYTLFMSDMEKILLGPGFANGVTPVLEWTASKKGTNYGIKWTGHTD